MHFTQQAVTRAGDGTRGAGDPAYNYGSEVDVSWTRGRERCLEQHTTNACRRAGTQVKTVVLEASCQGRTRMGGGTSGDEALRYIVRLLTRVLILASNNEVQQRLPNVVVAAGMPFSEYLVELRGIVSNLLDLALELMSEDGVQLAMKASLSDQYLSIGMVVFIDRAHLSRPFVYVADFLGRFDYLDQNTVGSQAFPHFGQAKAPGVVRRASNPGRSRHDGEFNAVARTETDLEEENPDMRKIVAGSEKKGRFVSNDKFGDPLFYTTFDSKQQKNAARRAFGDGA